MIELWMILALGTAFLWSLVDTIDKHVVDKYLKNPYVILCITGVVNLIAGLIVFSFGFKEIPLLELFLCFCIAFLNVLFVAAYLKAFKIEEVSRIVPLFQTSVIFIVALSFVFLGERLTGMQYAGIALLVIGAIMVSIKKNFAISEGSVYGLIAAFLSAITYFLFSYLEKTIDYYTVFAYSRVFLFILTLPLFFFLWKDLKESIRTGGRRFITAAASAEIFNSAGTLTLAWALSMGSASLVNALISTEPFMVLTITVFLTIFFPRLLKEEIDRGTVLYKLIAILLIFIGVWMIG